jgi:Integrase core domain
VCVTNVEGSVIGELLRTVLCDPAGRCDPTWLAHSVYGKLAETDQPHRGQLLADLAEASPRKATPKGQQSFISCDEGKLYLATLLDLFSRKLPAGPTAEHPDAELARDAIKMAAAVRGGRTVIDGVIFHADRGSTYTAKDFTRLCRRLGVVQSMGRVGSCFDNAASEAFFSTLEHEVPGVAARRAGVGRDGHQQGEIAVGLEAEVHVGGNAAGPRGGCLKRRGASFGSPVRCPGIISAPAPRPALSSSPGARTSTTSNDGTARRRCWLRTNTRKSLPSSRTQLK